MRNDKKIGTRVRLPIEYIQRIECHLLTRCIGFHIEEETINVLNRAYSLHMSQMSHIQSC